MSQDFSREIKKLEVRLGEVAEKTSVFLESVKNCVSVFEELNDYLNLAPKKRDLTKMISLHRSACEAYQEALGNHSNLDHEKSHLLDSYGALIATLERAFTASLS
jgi:hypothetical protein